MCYYKSGTINRTLRTIKRLLTIIVVFVFVNADLAAQVVCTVPGQNPATAFPVCGSSSFVQTTVPLCGGRRLPFGGCGQNSGLTDINPFWYKFTCYKAGTLGFLITPAALTDDYDWELYDVTNRNLTDVYNTGSLVVSNNWSGETGLTGASAAGTRPFVCGGTPNPLFSKMPSLQQGHDYLLLISHFTQSQSGYRLSFSGGTADITDTILPRMKKVEASCGGETLTLTLNRKIKCNSVASNGSDFYITPSGTSVSTVTGINCASGFDTDSLTLGLSGFLTPGRYVLHSKKGTDGNTVLNYCNNPMLETESIPFTILPKAPAVMDSLAPVTCAPRQLKLVFAKSILCSSIEPTGSDFRVAGPYPVTISSAGGACSGGTTREVILTLAAAMQQAGTFTLMLRNGTDGNTLVDECGEQVRAGSSLAFSIKDTVNADFSYRIQYGCSVDTVAFTHSGANGVTSWQWQLGDSKESSLQNPVANYTVFNEKKISLAVSNGICRDTATQLMLLDNFLKADFTVLEDNCPEEPITFTGTATGRIKAHYWEFGDSRTASVQSPTHAYAVPVRQMPFLVQYVVTDSFGCRSTAQKRIQVYPSCNLAIPNSFTPNGDGLNDFFHPLNAVKAEGLEFIIFNRWGQVIFKTKDWRQGWNGTINGKLQATGVFVWMLRYTNRDTKQRIDRKGTVTLIR